MDIEIKREKEIFQLFIIFLTTCKKRDSEEACARRLDNYAPMLREHIANDLRKKRDEIEKILYDEIISLKKEMLQKIGIVLEKFISIEVYRNVSLLKNILENKEINSFSKVFDNLAIVDRHNATNLREKIFYNEDITKIVSLLKTTYSCLMYLKNKYDGKDLEIGTFIFETGACRIYKIKSIGEKYYTIDLICEKKNPSWRFLKKSNIKIKIPKILGFGKNTYSVLEKNEFDNDDDLIKNFVFEIYKYD